MIGTGGVVPGGILGDLEAPRLPAEERVGHLHPVRGVGKVVVAVEVTPDREAVERGVGAVVLIVELPAALAYERVHRARLMAQPCLREQHVRDRQPGAVAEDRKLLDQVPDPDIPRDPALHLGGRSGLKGLERCEVLLHHLPHHRREFVKPEEPPRLRQPCECREDGANRIAWIALDRDDGTVFAHHAGCNTLLEEVGHRPDGRHPLLPSAGHTRVLRPVKLDLDDRRVEQHVAARRDMPLDEAPDRPRDALVIAACQHHDVLPQSPGIMRGADHGAARSGVKLRGQRLPAPPERAEQPVVQRIADGDDRAGREALAVGPQALVDQRLGAHDRGPLPRRPERGRKLRRERVMSPVGRHRDHAARPAVNHQRRLGEDRLQLADRHRVIFGIDECEQKPGAAAGGQ